MSRMPPDTAPLQSDPPIAELEGRDWFVLDSPKPVPRGWWEPGGVILVAPRPCYAGNARLRRPVWRVRAQELLPPEPHWHQWRCRRILFVEELPATAVFGPRGDLVEQVFGPLRRMSASQAAALAEAPWPAGLERAVSALAAALGLVGEAEMAQGTAYIGVTDEAEDLGFGRRRDCTPAVWAVDLDSLWSEAMDRAGVIASALVVADRLDPGPLAAVTAAWHAAFPETPLRTRE
jgi:hypothetical protein